MISAKEARVIYNEKQNELEAQKKIDFDNKIQTILLDLHQGISDTCSTRNSVDYAVAGDYQSKLYDILTELGYEVDCYSHRDGMCDGCEYNVNGDADCDNCDEREYSGAEYISIKW